MAPATISSARAACAIRWSATTATTTVSANGTGNVLYGQIGNDWVGVSGNSNVLNGAQGDDYIAASGHGNTLDGGAGNDQLVAGGHVGDRFVFHPGYGIDSITGFVRHGGAGEGIDVIDVNGFGLNFTTCSRTWRTSAATA